MAAGFGLAGVLIFAHGCTLPLRVEDLPGPATATTQSQSSASVNVTATPDTAQPQGGEEAGALAALESVIADVELTFGGKLGIATASSQGAIAAGFQDTSPAWSTVKVPIAIAALRTQPHQLVDAGLAITVSDNEAAERLFAASGAEAVNTVLKEAGVGTPVNDVVLRPGFSSFGQTALSVSDEAVLASRFACLEGADPVLEMMGRVDPSQSYGLGAVEGARFKGGWGPDEAGSYQVRQFGLIPRHDGTFAPAALSAFPADGAYATGQAMLTHAATTLATQAQSLPVAECWS